MSGSESNISYLPGLQEKMYNFGKIVNSDAQPHPAFSFVPLKNILLLPVNAQVIRENCGSQHTTECYDAQQIS